MNRPHLVIGSRGSDLALWQARFIRRVLENEHDCEVDIKIIKTSGDKIDTISFDKMEGKGFFTKELEEALLASDIDLAVHSLKDLMTSQPDGLKLGAVGYRADRREMLLVRKEARIDQGVIPVKDGGVIGTSSARRKAQIVHHNPNLRIKDLRGNVPTRINKLREGQYDAILIAAAGVTRLKLDLSDLEVIYLDAETFLPAPAQGILGIQIRSDDPRVEEIISRLGTSDAMDLARLERGLLARFDAGCSLPLGVCSERRDKGEFVLKAVLGHRKGEEAWGELRSIEVSGTDIKAIIDEAYGLLTPGKTQCA